MYTVARLRLDRVRDIRGGVLILSHLVAVGAVGAVGEVGAVGAVGVVEVVGVVMVCVVSIRLSLAVSIAFRVFCSRRVLSLPGSLRYFVAGSTK